MEEGKFSIVFETVAKMMASHKVNLEILEANGHITPEELYDFPVEANSNYGWTAGTFHPKVIINKKGVNYILPMPKWLGNGRVVRFTTKAPTRTFQTIEPWEEQGQDPTAGMAKKESVCKTCRCLSACNVSNDALAYCPGYMQRDDAVKKETDHVEIE